MNDIEIQTSETEFKKMAPEDRDWQILKTFHSQTLECNSRFCAVEGEINKIKARKWFHAGASAIGGFIGGITAVIGKAVFFK
jgi:hypothetical protein